MVGEHRRCEAVVLLTVFVGKGDLPKTNKQTKKKQYVALHGNESIICCSVGLDMENSFLEMQNILCLACHWKKKTQQN